MLLLPFFSRLQVLHPLRPAIGGFRRPWTSCFRCPPEEIILNLALAAATVGLTSEAAQHLEDIVTESDQFSIEEFIPLLREHMNVLNPYVRQFLVGWITVLDSVPDIEMLGFLPDFLDVLLLKSVDYGRMAEILVQRAASPYEFTRLTAITWISEFLKLGGDQLVPYYADILGAILPCISDKEEKIRVVARETNEELHGIKVDPAEVSNVGSILSIARSQLSSQWEATKIEALHWISTLLNRHCPEVLTFLEDIFDTLLTPLSDSSDEVMLLVLEVHAWIAKNLQHFRHLVVFLMHNFRADNSLLEKHQHASAVIQSLVEEDIAFREFVLRELRAAAGAVTITSLMGFGMLAIKLIR
ncbi:hypothetical protein L484_012907 [Morus notabilis]|uniref:Protein VAC14-like protein n=1 Tax=Morus notabilis TaxID=981085 RepID=W9R1L7_9ROSA|nr:hypothetical protein L484_012907 [Morus notabilis]